MLRALRCLLLRGGYVTVRLLNQILGVAHDLRHLVRQWIEEVFGDLRVFGNGFFSRKAHEGGARSNAIIAQCVELRGTMRDASEVRAKSLLPSGALISTSIRILH